MRLEEIGNPVVDMQLRVTFSCYTHATYYSLVLRLSQLLGFQRSLPDR